MNQPAFDWLTFDELQATRDRILQESVAFYDPAVQVILFVFLPSKSGNSVAIWRRKLRVPNNLRLAFQREISLAMAALRKDKDYVLHVDECAIEILIRVHSPTLFQDHKQEGWSSVVLTSEASEGSRAETQVVANLWMTVSFTVILLVLYFLFIVHV